jgi:hypothetical protein
MAPKMNAVLDMPQGKVWLSGIVADLCSRGPRFVS